MNRLALRVFCAVLISASPASTQDRIDRVVVPLRDPDRVATLDLHLVRGTLNVTAGDRRDIVIESRTLTPSPSDTPGLKRITRSSLDIEEWNNVVTVRSPRDVQVDVTIHVPVRTHLKLKKTVGTVAVRGLDGDLEVTVSTGSIRLLDVSGSVVAHATTGAITATVRRVTPDRPMAFTSYTGGVDVTLPRSIRADFLLRSDFGGVLSDFDVQEKGPGPATQPGSGFRQSANQVRVSVNGGGPEIEIRSYTGGINLRRGN